MLGAEQEQAEKYKEQGNAFFKEQKYPAAVDAYTKGVELSSGMSQHI